MKIVLILSAVLLYIFGVIWMLKDLSSYLVVVNTSGDALNQMLDLHARQGQILAIWELGIVLTVAPIGMAVRIMRFIDSWKRNQPAQEPKAEREER